MRSEANRELGGQEVVRISRPRGFRLIGVLKLHLRVGREPVSERQVNPGEISSPLRATASPAPDRPK